MHHSFLNIVYKFTMLKFIFTRKYDVEIIMRNSFNYLLIYMPVAIGEILFKMSKEQNSLVTDMLCHTTAKTGR